MYFVVPATYERYPPVPCWQPLGRPVVPLVYIRKSGASEGMGTGSTVLPAYFLSTSSTKKSRPSTIGVLEWYFPCSRRQTRTFSTVWFSPLAVCTAISAFSL